MSFLHDATSWQSGETPGPNSSNDFYYYYYYNYYYYYYS